MATIIDIRPDHVRITRSEKQGEKVTETVDAAVTPTTASRQLYQYNLPEADSLNPATGLKDLFPGLKLKGTREPDTLQPVELVTRYRPQPAPDDQLIIRSPGEEFRILQALAEQGMLKTFSTLVVQVHDEPLYENAEPADRISGWLQKQGFEQKKVYADDPDWPLREFTRNFLQNTVDALKLENKKLLEKVDEQDQKARELVEENQSLKQARQKMRSQLEESEVRLQKAASAEVELRKLHERKCKKLMEEAGELEKLLLSKKNKINEVEQHYKEAKLELEERRNSFSEVQKKYAKLQQLLNQEISVRTQLDKELANATERLLEHKGTGAKLIELEKKINVLGINLTKHIDKKLINTAKQIESAQGLQNYLSTGELPLNYHGWPISPDLALYLTEKLESQNYDLIIEFGSGTSTALFAKVLIKKNFRDRADSRLRKITDNKVINPSEKWLEDAELSSDSDLPKRILTFEHNRIYHKKTDSMLRAEGLDKLVDLVFSPLVDYTCQGEDYLYYDCDEDFERLAKLYEGREPRILVLVDGPPGSTGPNARFPALPKLLNHLPRAKFDVVLDDYDRNEEKNVAEKWIEFLKKRSISYSEVIMPFEKGAVCISINFD